MAEVVYLISAHIVPVISLTRLQQKKLVSVARLLSVLIP